MPLGAHALPCDGTRAMALPPASPPATPPRPLLLGLAYLAFVSLGLPDAVLGVAWPSLRDTFALPQAGMGAILTATAGAYFASGLLAGRLIRSLGIGLLLVASTTSVTLGLFGYTTVPSFALFLIAACFIGFGSGAIDAGLNTYAAQHFGARHMTWLHAAYSTGAAIGPVLMTATLTRGAGWRAGYDTLCSVLGLLCIAFIALSRQWDAPPAADAAEEPVALLPASAALRRPRVWLQVLLFFIYTGMEVTAGQWSYTVLTEERGLGRVAAGSWVTLYWGSLLAGRIVLGFVVERVGAVRLLRLAAGGAVVGALLFALPALPPALGLGLLGFSLAPIFPALMSETPRRVGRDVAAHAVGFQVSAATLGVAALPSLAGLLGERVGLSAVAPQILVCAVVFAGLHELLVASADRPPVPSPR